MGYKALSISVDKAGVEETEEPSKFDKWVEKTFGDKMMNAIMAVSTVLGILLAIALFFVLPTFIFNLIQNYAAGSAIAPWRMYVFCCRIPENSSADTTVYRNTELDLFG